MIKDRDIKRQKVDPFSAVKVSPSTGDREERWGETNRWSIDYGHRSNFFCRWEKINHEELAEGELER